MSTISKETVKALGGLFSIMSLLTLIVLDVTSQDIKLTDKYLYLLLLMISAFLGMDFIQAAR